jgi:hypothetical protein
MGDPTGGIRSRRGPSACNGYKTLLSTMVSDNGSGAGSVRRMYGWHKRNGTTSDFINSLVRTDVRVSARSELFLKSVN